MRAERERREPAGWVAAAALWQAEAAEVVARGSGVATAPARAAPTWAAAVGVRWMMAVAGAMAEAAEEEATTGAAAKEDLAAAARNRWAATARAAARQGATEEVWCFLVAGAVRERAWKEAASAAQLLAVAAGTRGAAAGAQSRAVAGVMGGVVVERNRGWEGAHQSIGVEAVRQEAGVQAQAKGAMAQVAEGRREAEAAGAGLAAGERRQAAGQKVGGVNGGRRLVSGGGKRWGQVHGGVGGWGPASLVAGTELPAAEGTRRWDCPWGWGCELVQGWRRQVRAGWQRRGSKGG